ncbi:Similar to TES-26: 26 kDa secreted antigen (Toxocara canis) [Cotesia congregata]|uniref:Similar to TES-26: 26 kDa secreted antigen (Toxocara canis) n=1 Tax=Cotesia congregata TaxID=51543 RepID=A0A8J2ENN2_COTCN|nr:Similar to TES-26: 26 kDa secreted antigen (Toxocara canis) [Cotesia congregata]
MKMLTILVAVIVLVDLADSTKKSVPAAFKAANLSKVLNITIKNLKLMTVTYPDPPKKVFLGNNLTQTDTSTEPTYDFDYRTNRYYALLMTDPDVPSPSISLPGEFFHWFVGNIPGNRSSSGEDILNYFPPVPPPGTKPHRYTFLLYRQRKKMNFSDGSLLGIDLTNRLMRRASVLAKELNLGDPIAGNFFYKGFDVPVVHGALNVV